MRYGNKVQSINTKNGLNCLIGRGGRDGTDGRHGTSTIDVSQFLLPLLGTGLDVLVLDVLLAGLVESVVGVVLLGDIEGLLVGEEVVENDAAVCDDNTVE